jgi:hypothetical protein
MHIFSPKCGEFWGSERFSGKVKIGYPQTHRLWISSAVDEILSQNLRFFPFGRTLSTGNPQLMRLFAAKI